MCLEIALHCHFEEGAVFACHEERFVPGFEQRLMEPQNLPLASTHLAAAIEMEDFHLAISRAFAYFVKV